MSFETHFFPFGNEPRMCYETRMVSKFMSFTVGSYRRREGERSTATVTCDQAIKKKKKTRLIAVYSDGVARLVEMSSVIKVVLLAMCVFVLAFCLVGCYLRWDLSFSDNDSVLFGTCHQVQLSIYVSSVFAQSGFLLHSGFAEDFPPDRSGFFATFDCRVICTTGTPTASSAPCGGYCLSALKWLSYGNRKCPSRRTILRYGCLQYYLNIQKTQFHRSASLLNLIDSHRHWKADSNAIPFVKKTSFCAVVLDRYDLKWIFWNFYSSFDLNYRLLSMSVIQRACTCYCSVNKRNAACPISILLAVVATCSRRLHIFWKATISTCR